MSKSSENQAKFEQELLNSKMKLGLHKLIAELKEAKLELNGRPDTITKSFYEDNEEAIEMILSCFEEEITAINN